MTLILGLQAHAEGRQMMPAALIAGTPWADLDKIGDSYVVNEGVDNVLGTYDHLIRAAAQVYADGHDLKDPLISPVYASDSILFKRSLDFSGLCIGFNFEGFPADIIGFWNTRSFLEQYGQNAYAPFSQPCAGRTHCVRGRVARSVLF